MILVIKNMIKGGYVIEQVRLLSRVVVELDCTSYGGMVSIENREYLPLDDIGVR